MTIKRNMSHSKRVNCMSGNSVWSVSFKALTVDSMRYFAWQFCDIWHMVYANKKAPNCGRCVTL